MSSATAVDPAKPARIARILMDGGYRKERPLKGGLDAWIAAVGEFAMFDIDE